MFGFENLVMNSLRLEYRSISLVRKCGKGDTFGKMIL